MIFPLSILIYPTKLSIHNSEAILLRDYNTLESRRTQFRQKITALCDILQADLFKHKPSKIQSEDLLFLWQDMQNELKAYSDKAGIVIENIERIHSSKPLRICDDEDITKLIPESFIESKGGYWSIVGSLFIHLAFFMWDTIFSAWYHSQHPVVYVDGDMSWLYPLLTFWYTPYNTAIQAWINCTALYNITFCSTIFSNITNHTY